MRLLKHVLFVAVLMVALGQVAQANTIGVLTLTNCGTMGTGCPAATYSFNIGNTSASLSITINGGLTSTNNLIGGVNLGFTNLTLGNLSGSVSSNLSGASWSFVQASLTSNGCNLKSGSKFACAMVTTNPGSNGVALTVGQTYTWTWNYNAISPTGIFAVGDVHIGANYNPGSGLIVSQTGATVPEPMSLLLLGSGLLGVGLLRRRFNR